MPDLPEEAVAPAPPTPPEAIFKEPPAPPTPAVILEPVAENVIIEAAPPIETPQAKVKKPKSKKQLEHLARIRQKSLDARKAKKMEKEAEAKKPVVEKKVQIVTPTPATPAPNGFVSMADVEGIVSRRLAERDAKKATARAQAAESRAKEMTEKNAEKAALDKKIKQKEMALDLIRPGRKKRGNFY